MKLLVSIFFLKDNADHKFKLEKTVTLSPTSCRGKIPSVPMF